MVVEFEFLPRKPFVLGHPIQVTDVVMGTYEERLYLEGEGRSAV
jgi:hypothetical protein